MKLISKWLQNHQERKTPCFVTGGLIALWKARTVLLNWEHDVMWNVAKRPLPAPHIPTTYLNEPQT